MTPNSAGHLTHPDEKIGISNWPAIRGGSSVWDDYFSGRRLFEYVRKSNQKCGQSMINRLLECTVIRVSFDYRDGL